MIIIRWRVEEAVYRALNPLLPQQPWRQQVETHPQFRSNPLPNPARQPSSQPSLPAKLFQTNKTKCAFIIQQRHPIMNKKDIRMIYRLVTLLIFTNGLQRFSVFSHKVVDICLTLNALVNMKLRNQAARNTFCFRTVCWRENLDTKILKILLYKKQSHLSSKGPEHNESLTLTENFQSHASGVPTIQISKTCIKRKFPATEKINLLGLRYRQDPV